MKPFLPRGPPSSSAPTLRAVDEALRDRAERLRALHHEREILVLPNAWDVASARLFASSQHCRAVATTSSGVAATLGYPDGERVSAQAMLEVVARIASAVDLPVSADLEGGYGDAAATAKAAIAAGAAGLNLEDGTRSGDRPLVDLAAQVDRLRAVRAVADAAGVPLVLNARTDGYLRGRGDFADTVTRANVYLEAGADCVFVIGVTDRDLIARLVREIEGPLNVLATAGSPTIAELERLGVARVSFASAPLRAALGVVRRITDELFERGTYDLLLDRPLTHAQLTELVS